jgi:hypothetical protein
LDGRRHFIITPAAGGPGDWVDGQVGEPHRRSRGTVYEWIPPAAIGHCAGGRHRSSQSKRPDRRRAAATDHYLGPWSTTLGADENLIKWRDVADNTD